MRALLICSKNLSIGALGLVLPPVSPTYTLLHRKLHRIYTHAVRFHKLIDAILDLEVIRVRFLCGITLLNFNASVRFSAHTWLRDGMVGKPSCTQWCMSSSLCVFKVDQGVTHRDFAIYMGYKISLVLPATYLLNVAPEAATREPLQGVGVEYALVYVAYATGKRSI